MLEKICIISDTHFGAQSKLLFDKVSAENNFKLLIDQINREHPTYIFVLGVLTLEPIIGYGGCI